MTFTDRERFDVICVGDTATDVYITLSAAKAEIRREDGRTVALFRCTQLLLYSLTP